MSQSKPHKQCCLIPRGPYPTGCCDLMVGKGSDGLLMRLFYPSSISNINDQQSHWTKWYLGPHYNKGLARHFAPYASPLYQVLSNHFTKKAVVPAVWEAGVAEGVFPVMIFSHGLMAHRGLSSSICNDLASYGYIVAALEHKDRSACATFTLTENGDKKWTLLKIVKSAKKEFETRSSQVQIRASECSRALDILDLLNRGEAKCNELPSSLSLREFKGKIDTSRPIISGHSFGGATAVLTLARDPRFTAGICLDPWMFSLHGLKEHNKKSVSEADQEEMKNLSLPETIKQPILFILNDTFQEKSNLQTLKAYENTNNAFWTLLNSPHQSHNDTPILFKEYPSKLKKFIGCASVVPPEVALNLTNNLMINFINKSLDIKAPYYEEHEDYMCKNNKWLTEGAIGKADQMLGWDSGVTKV